MLLGIAPLELQRKRFGFMLVLMYFIETLVGLVACVLLFIYAEEVARLVDDVIGTSFVRDANNPWTYRIVAVLGGLYAVYMLVSIIIS